jgi:hypothetical protein
MAVVPNITLERTKIIFDPSGDQPGSKQAIDCRSENAPPQPGIGT